MVYAEKQSITRFFSNNEYHDYLDFFHASISGNFKLMFLEIGNLFDSDTRSSGVANLKTCLVEQGFHDFKDHIESKLSPYTMLVKHIISIRNKLMAHKDIDADSDVIFKKYGITPNEIGQLLVDLGLSLQKIEHHLNNDSSFTNICLNDRYHDATINLLKILKRGNGS